MQKIALFLGILGGIVGIIGGLAILMTWEGEFIMFGESVTNVRDPVVLAVGVSLLGLAGPFAAGFARSAGAAALVVAAIVGLFALNFYFLLPATLFFVASIAVARAPADKARAEPTQPPALDPGAPPPSVRTQVACPRCKTRVNVGAERPLRVRCPTCGSHGTLTGISTHLVPAASAPQANRSSP